MCVVLCFALLHFVVCTEVLYCNHMFTQITSKAINFRELYKSHTELKKAEIRNEFPPRFKLKLNCYKSSITLNLKYRLCIKRKMESEEYFTLNIFVKGRKPVQQAASCKFYC